VLLADRYLVTAALGRSLPFFCAQLGIEIIPLMAEFGIDVGSFQQTDKFISLSKFTGLLEKLAHTVSDQTFGLRYGVNFKLGNTGPFGFGLMNAPSFGHAVKFYARFIGLMADHTYFSTEIGIKTVSMNWSFSPLIVARGQYVDMGTLLTIRQFRQFAGNSWTPKAVELEREKPDSLDLHQSFVSNDLTFRANSNSIHFSKEHMSYQNPEADHRIFEIMEHQCEIDLKKKESLVPLVFKIREEILQRLVGGNFSLQAIAQKFGMSERNMQRRLAENGTTFERILDDTRKELSDQLLRDTKLSLTDIAFLMGYSCPNAYSRAAKAWYSQPPSRMRGNFDAESLKVKIG
jgi:AraC-like DNA-binding protein